MKTFHVALAILGAFLAQTLVGRYVASSRTYFDLFLLAASAFGLTSGRLTGMVAGTAGGLVQDAFSGGILGVNGFSKTTVGYVAGVLGNRLIIRGSVARFAFFALASLVDLVILILIGVAVEKPLVWGEGAKAIYVCVGNGILGTVILGLEERFNRSR